LCKGCGTCASWCPTGAISAKHFTDRQIDSMLEALFASEAQA
jgi:heterodisulfide reductase subunit A